MLNREQVFAEAARRFLCKNCGELFGPLDLARQFRDARCQHCDADIEGKVYPKRRETERNLTFDTRDSPVDAILQVVLDKFE